MGNNKIPGATDRFLSEKAHKNKCPRCVRWPTVIRNEDVYTTTKIQPWSKKIKKQRMTWFGHLIRMPSNITAKKSFPICSRAFSGIQRKTQANMV